MVAQLEAWVDKLGGDYELTVFGKRTVVATEVVDVRLVLNLRPSVLKTRLSAVCLYKSYYSFQCCRISAHRLSCIFCLAHTMCSSNSVAVGVSHPLSPLPPP